MIMAKNEKPYGLMSIPRFNCFHDNVPEGNHYKILIYQFL